MDNYRFRNEANGIFHSGICLLSFLGAFRALSLTGLTSFSHLLNLENLDISRNDIDSLRREFSNPFVWFTDIT